MGQKRHFMVLSKKTMMMAGISLAAVAAQVVLAGVGMNNKTVEATGTEGLTLTLNSTNGLNIADHANAGTYTWNTTTVSPYFVTWNGSGINYNSNGGFLHIAQITGEFHNTVTLHQITSIYATGTESGSTTAYLTLYTATTAGSWNEGVQFNSGDTKNFSASANIGFIKFAYAHSENYVTEVKIT